MGGGAPELSLDSQRGNKRQETLLYTVSVMFLGHVMWEFPHFNNPGAKLKHRRAKRYQPFNMLAHFVRLLRN